MKTQVFFICVSFLGIGALFAFEISAQLKVEDTVGIWLFDEGRGKKAGEMAGKGLDGELINGPQWVNGKFGKAIRFDGSSQYVEVNDPLNVGEFGTSHSISVWVNPGATQNAHADMLGNHGKPGGYEIEQRGGEQNNFYFGMKINDTWQGGPWANRPSTKLADGEWNHFVVIRDTKTIKHYLNGKKTVEYKISDDRVDDSEENFLFAHSACCAGRNFKGILDEIVIFKKAVGVDDVRALSKGVDAAMNVESASKLTTIWGKLKTYYGPIP
jgi:hypothetical protein